MTRTREDISKELDSKIPRNEVSTREAGNGVQLSYLTGYYVINRLNQVLGQGNWAFEVVEPKCVREGEIERYGKKSFSANYIAKGVLTVVIGDRKVVFSDYGYGDGTDKVDPGKPHELAIKEATTDALKRCAKNLGQSMGLALYDKTQENVENEQGPKVESKGVGGQTTTTGTDSGQAKPRDTSAPSGGGISTASPEKTKTGLPKTQAAVGPKRQAIKAGVEVLIAKQKITAQEFRTKYGLAAKVADLPDSDIVPLYDKVKKDFPELELN